MDETFTAGNLRQFTEPFPDSSKTNDFVFTGASAECVYSATTPPDPTNSGICPTDWDAYAPYQCCSSNWNQMTKFYCNRWDLPPPVAFC